MPKIPENAAFNLFCFLEKFSLYLCLVLSYYLIFAALPLMAPFGFVPFSNTLPAYAILLMSIGMSQRDGLVVIAGYLLILASLIYFGALIWLATQAGPGLFGFFSP